VAAQRPSMGDWSPRHPSAFLFRPFPLVLSCLGDSQTSCFSGAWTRVCLGCALLQWVRWWCEFLLPQVLGGTKRTPVCFVQPRVIAGRLSGVRALAPYRPTSLLAVGTFSTLGSASGNHRGRLALLGLKPKQLLFLLRHYLLPSSPLATFSRTAALLLLLLCALVCLARRRLM